jgi:hypothetical protein
MYPGYTNETPQQQYYPPQNYQNAYQPAPEYSSQQMNYGYQGYQQPTQQYQYPPSAQQGQAYAQAPAQAAQTYSQYPAQTQVQYGYNQATTQATKDNVNPETHNITITENDPQQSQLTKENLNLLVAQTAKPLQTPQPPPKKQLDEKQKRKQIELELKKWEREQQQKSFSNQQMETDNVGTFQATTGNLEAQRTGSISDKVVENVETNRTTEDKNKAAASTAVICKICKRKFPNQDSLVNHEKFSDLHKENLEKSKLQGK